MSCQSTPGYSTYLYVGVCACFKNQNPATPPANTDHLSLHYHL
ncbi:unnamed protein product, partial [Staurois parvus]